MRHARPDIPPGRGGFTLLELLAALGMTVILAGSLAACLFIAFKAKASAEAAVASTRAVDTAMDVIGRDLANTLPPVGQLAGVFTGTADSLSFYTTGPEPKASLQGDVRKVEFALDIPNAPAGGAGGAQALVRRVTTNLLPDVEVDPPQEVVCRNAASLGFRYYDGANWTDTWDSTQTNNTMPVAVEVTLILNGPQAGVGGDRPGARPPAVRIIPLACGVPDTSQLALPGMGGR